MAAENPQASELVEPIPPLGVALDADLGVRPDALLAVALLNGFAARNEARRISLSVSRPSLTAARLADVLSEYYPILPLNAGYCTVGMPEGAPPAQDAPALAAVLARQTPESTPLYPSNVRRLLDTADNATLIRNMLLAQHDGNAAVVLAGPATGLARLLDFNGARAQIASKVRLLVVAIGSTGRPEPSITQDLPAARKLLGEWPTPLVLVGAELGEALRFPAARIEQGFAAEPAQPVAAAYPALGRMPFDSPTSALAAVLHAVHPDADYFRLSEPGNLTLADDGRVRLTPSAQGRQRLLLPNPARAQALLALYESLVTAPPAPRPVRRKPPGADVQAAAGAPGAPPPGTPVATPPAASVPAASTPAPAAPPRGTP